TTLIAVSALAIAAAIPSLALAKSITHLATPAQIEEACADAEPGSKVTGTITLADGTEVTGTIKCKATTADDGDDDDDDGTGQDKPGFRDGKHPGQGNDGEDHSAPGGDGNSDDAPGH